MLLFYLVYRPLPGIYLSHFFGIAVLGYDVFCGLLSPHPIQWDIKSYLCLVIVGYPLFSSKTLPSRVPWCV